MTRARNIANLLDSSGDVNTDALDNAGGGMTGGGTDKLFLEANQTSTESYTIGATTNAMSIGKMTVASGDTITVTSGGRWVIV